MPVLFGVAQKKINCKDLDREDGMNHCTTLSSKSPDPKSITRAMMWIRYN